MEQKLREYYIQGSAAMKIHKRSELNNNDINSNRTRITIIGKRYTIDNERLEIYKTIGDIIIAVGVVVGAYIMYCIMWMYQ